MREIKFRAWLSELKHMTFSHTLKQLVAWAWPENTDSVIWMQYTGLKDKNGKEIYEGDIVEAKDPYKYNSKEIFYTCEVVFTEGAAFMLKHTYENWGTVGIRYFGLRDMELEVIGNIYENPELLEGDGEK